jgi:hypothetical protein
VASATIPARSPRKLYIDIRAVCHAVATGGFIAVFPGYFIYHFLLATELIPAVLGGLIGNLSILIASYCIFLSFYLLRDSVWGGLNLSRLFLCAWGFYFIWAVTGAFTVLGESHAPTAIREVTAMLVYWLSMFFVGSMFKLDGWVSKTAFIVAASAVIVCLIASVLLYASLLGPLMVFSPSDDAEVASSTYQGAGRSIVITSVVAAAYVSGQWRQLGILTLAVVVLLSLGSRTYLVAGSACLVFWACVAAVRHKQLIALTLFVGLVGTAAYSIREFVAETRAGELVDLAGSASWQDRVVVMDRAWNAIASNPFLGDFAYHIRNWGTGNYAHNALSAWPEFGLIGFLLYLSLLAIFAVTAFRRMFSTDPRWQAAVGLNVVTLVVILAEPVYSLVPAVGWGFVVNALMYERRTRRLRAAALPAIASPA